MTSYGNLNPDEVPLLILNGFEYVTQWGSDPHSIPLRADTSKPKLTQQDVTDLIAYMNKGGSVLIMENVMSNLKERAHLALYVCLMPQVCRWRLTSR